MPKSGPSTTGIPKPSPFFQIVGKVAGVIWRAAMAGVLLGVAAPLFAGLITGVSHSFFGLLVAKSIYQPMVLKVASMLPTVLQPIASFFPLFPLGPAVIYSLYQRYVSTRYLGNKEVLQKIKSSSPLLVIISVAATVAMFNVGASMLHWSIFGGMAGVLKIVTEEFSFKWIRQMWATPQQKNLLPEEQASQGQQQAAPPEKDLGQGHDVAAAALSMGPAPFLPSVDLGASAESAIDNSAQVVDKHTKKFQQPKPA